MTRAVIGVDIGTSSSKAVLCAMDGRILATAERTHEVSFPFPGHVEMDASVWWREFADLTREVLTRVHVTIEAVGISGMGPCTLLTGLSGRPLRPAILYGVDTRAVAEIERLTALYTEAAIVARCGSALTSQAVGPKLAWVARHEPDVFAAARRLFMPSSYVVWQLTGEYVLDHHSASQAVPLYDRNAGAWHMPWWTDLAGAIEPPDLRWSGDVAGTVTASAAAITGLPHGVPVVTGTIDAWAEALSVDAQDPGDVMLMYGTTMFMVATLGAALTAPPLWGTVGTRPGSRCLAAGMATSGAITRWLRDLTGGDYTGLLADAEASGAGANGLLMLPYFAGERTPIDDPKARGVIAGLTLTHTAGDLYRAALEGIALGVRHNLDALDAAGAAIECLTAVGGGTRGGLWPQIVSDVTGRPQQLRTHAIGASLGCAYLAASAIGDTSIAEWNPPAGVIEPRTHLRSGYDDLYRLYRELADRTAPVAHALADRQIERHRARAYDEPTRPTMHAAAPTARRSEQEGRP